MLRSQSTRSRFMSESFGSRRSSTARRTSVTLRQLVVGERRFSIATLTGQESAFVRMEQAMMTFSLGGGRRAKSSSGRKSHKHLHTFSRVVRIIILLLKCFRMRRKFAVQSRNMTLTHREQTGDFAIFSTSSISRELHTILSTPPEHRTKEDLRKVQFYLRATGASRLLASASTPEDLDNLSRYVAYERYENDRIVAQQGRTPNRFYFVVTGKLLIVKEYHIDTGIISKTVGSLTKGMTTDVEEMEQRTLRRASLICLGPVETLVLDCDDYFLIHGERGGAPREFLSRHALFRFFPFHSVKCHKHLIRLQYFPKGSVIFAGGEEFDWIYAIKSGECSLLRVQIVSDLKRKNYPLFNKRSAEELGCQRIRRTQSAAEKLADFRMWQGVTKQSLSLREERSLTVPNIRRNKALRTFEGKNKMLSNSRAILGESHDAGLTRDPYSPSTLQLSRIFTNSENGNPSPRPSLSSHSLIKNELTSLAQAHAPDIIPTLSRSRLTPSLPPKAPHEDDPRRKLVGSKISAPSLRQAYLELGKLRSGDVLGFEDSKVQVEDLPHIRLVSDTGAEVVLINRKFFLRNAPTSLLSQISYQTSIYPGIEKARSDYETLEAWSIYKTSLMRVLTSRNNIPEQRKAVGSRGRLPKNCLPFHRSRQAQEIRDKDAHTPQYIPPGTADRSKKSMQET